MTGGPPLSAPFAYTTLFRSLTVLNAMSQPSPDAATVSRGNPEVGNSTSDRTTDGAELTLKVAGADRSGFCWSHTWQAKNVWRPSVSGGTSKTAARTPPSP